MNEDTSWEELAVRLVSIEEAATIKGYTPKAAKNSLKRVRRELVQKGWVFVKIQVANQNPDYDTDTRIVEAIPPTGYTIDEWLIAMPASEPYVRPEQREHWEAIAEKTGRPVLTWREMAILGWSTQKALDHRGTATLGVAKNRMREERQKLRAEGWTFDVRDIGSPPALQPRTNDYLQEKADAQQKSNWLLRLPASAT